MANNTNNNFVFGTACEQDVAKVFTNRGYMVTFQGNHAAQCKSQDLRISSPNKSLTMSVKALKDNGHFEIRVGKFEKDLNGDYVFKDTMHSDVDDVLNKSFDWVGLSSYRANLGKSVTDPIYVSNAYLSNWLGNFRVPSRAELGMLTTEPYGKTLMRYLLKELKPEIDAFIQSGENVSEIIPCHKLKNEHGGIAEMNIVLRKNGTDYSVMLDLPTSGAHSLWKGVVHDSKTVIH